MAAHRLTPPPDASSPVDGPVRKRVCKACDRCRLKKSKCDGNSPCGRCQSDNAICVFGERRKSQDKVYPKGFVEQLENNQPLMVAGLQEMYKRMVAAGAWEGPLLKDSLHGAPLTHDILEKLGVLKKDTEGNMEYFEDDPEMIKVRLFAHGAQAMQRQGSEISGCGSDRDPSVFNSPVFDNSIPAHRYSHFGDYDLSQTPPTPPTMSSPFGTGPRILNGYEYIQSYMGSGGIQSSMDPMVLQHQFRQESKFGVPSYGMIDSPFRSTSTPDQLFMGAQGDEDLQFFSR